MKKLRYFIPFLILLISCEKEVVFKEYQDIAMLQWKKENVLKYTYNNIESADYQLKISLRHHSEIAYGDLPVQIKITTPGGEEISNPYILSLRDPETGMPKGESMGDITDIDILLEENMPFAETGNYTFEVSQTTDDEIANGVLEVGVIISKKGEN